MQVFQQRVVDEKVQLDDKISRLKPFLNSDKVKILVADERIRMIKQLDLMEKYSAILGERISNFQ